jgi:MFS family permease
VSAGASSAWRALRHRNFRLFFVGQGISVIGTWMTRMATSWLVYRLTQSALLLGVVSFVSQVVPFLMQPVAGAWVDRLDRRQVLLWTQAAAAVQSLMLAALALSKVITIGEVIALSAFQGFINAFDTPARHSFLIQMVEGREDLGNAIALNSSMQNGARLLGPAIAGAVIAATGEGVCFLIDGLSYFAVIASLLMMRVPARSVARAKASLLREMREGWDYMRSFRPVRTVLLIFSVTSLMGYPFTVLLPVFTRQMLHGGPHLLGWLTAASGVGALTSALSLTVRRTPYGLPRMIQVSAAVLGVALICFGFSTVLWLSLPLLSFAGFGLMQTAAASNTIIQTLVPEDKRARIISYYAMAFYGAAPFGSLLAGALADRIGASWTVTATGIACILGAAWFTTQVGHVNAALRALPRPQVRNTEEVDAVATA